MKAGPFKVDDESPTIIRKSDLRPGAVRVTEVSS